MEDRSGYVYLLKADVPFIGCYKIGRTGSPRRRLHDFGVRLPFETKPILIVRAMDMYDLEGALHSAMSFRRVGGEWFQLSTVEVEFVKAALLFAEADTLVERMAARRPVFEGYVEATAFAGYLRRWATLMTRLVTKFERRLGKALTARQAVSDALCAEQSPPPASDT